MVYQTLNGLVVKSQTKEDIMPYHYGHGMKKKKKKKAKKTKMGRRKR